MTAATELDVGLPSPTRRRSFLRYWRGNLKGSEFTWALAFSVPYIAVFLAFVAYPVFYGLWMGSNPALYAEVFSDVIYQDTVVNTLLFVAVGVNLKLFVLPWAVPQLPAFISLHWMLNGEWGLLNNALWILGGIEGPSWLNERWTALGSAIAAHLWKWTPFWTVILLAGRMSIPQDIYDAAKVDGATGLSRFLFVTFPLLANLYLVLTLLATIF